MKPASSRFRIRPSGLTRLPRAAAGLRIGLYGGSFNPAHAGHRHVSLMALRRLGLDRVWWIVTPGNPLKDTGELATTAMRVEEAKQVSDDPRIDVTAFEEEIGARYTVDTLSYLKRRYPGVHFVWIMGADNLASFHRWRGWRRSKTAAALSASRIGENEALALPGRKPPAWVFLHGPRSHLSSTKLRQMRRTSPAGGR